VKEFLSQQAIPFREADVSRDPAAAAEMVRISGQQGVPVTVVDGQVIVGFDRARLTSLLAKAHRPHLGAAVADAAAMAAKGRSSSARGAYVGKVTPGGAAERAGLQAGDVIIRIANRAVDSALDLEQLLSRIAPGQAVPLTYLRDSREQRTEIRL
jgi:S1-C subfamily serine protease